MVIHLPCLAQARPGEQRGAGGRRLEQTVQIGGHHLAVGAEGAVAAAIVQAHGGRGQCRAGADPGMDLVAADVQIIQGQTATHIAQLLFRLQHGGVVEQAETRTAARRAFQAVGIVDARAEHLKAAADAEDLAAVAQVAGDGGVPAVLAQARQVGAHALRAGQDDQVGRRYRLAGADELQIHLRVQAQRVEVGVVADARQHRHRHAQHFAVLVRLQHLHRILGLQVEVHQVRQHAEHRLAGTRFQPVQPRLQQGDVAAEAVDHEAFDPRLLARRKQLQGADQVGEHPALVDIGDQQHRAVHRLGEAHVGDVAGPEVDLGRRTGALHHHHRVLRGEARVGFEHRRAGDLLVVVVGHRVHVADGAALDDHLGAGIGVGLEQHRVHVGVRRQARGLGLHRLGAADLAAVGGHRAVERHILRLERHHADALAFEPAAEGGHQGALAGIRGGALDHQSGHAGLSCSACSRRCQPASSAGRPKRRQRLSANRRSRMPRRAK